MRGIWSFVIVLAVSASSFGVTTETWDWVTQCQAYHAAFSGNGGAVLHFGDSITYANQYTAWMRGRSGATTEDNNIMDWMHSLGRPLGSGPTDDTSDFATILAEWQLDGTWLAYIDRAGGGSYTAQSSIRSDQYRNGTYNLPTPEAMLDAYQPEVVILMLGTNDVTASRTPDNFEADMRNILEHIIYEDGNTSGSYRGTVPIISTIPPYVGKVTEVQAMNARVVLLAEEFGLPLIDYYGEIMDRQPTNWDSTLISGDGVHPSSSWGSYNSGTSPYLDGGAPLDYVGFLLRGWLSIQKLKEVKSQVIDGTPGTLTITTTSLPDGYVGTAYSNSLAATGGTPPYSWAQTGGTMAPGLTLNSDGTITGTPNTAGDYTFTAQVTDQDSNTDTQELTLTISAGGTPVTVDLTPVKDTHIDSANPDNNHGASTNIAMGGNNGQPGWVRISLLEFDLPVDLAGGTVNSATLTLYANNDYRGGEAVICQALQSWTEGSGDGSATGDGATWNTYDGTNAWPGGDFFTGANWSDITLGSGGNKPVSSYTDGSYTFSCVVNGCPDSEKPAGDPSDPGYTAIDDWDTYSDHFVSFDVTELVQNWADGDPNNGLAMCMNGKITRDGGSSFFTYGYGNVAWLTKEFGTPGYEPELSITYQTGGGGDSTPPTVTLSAISLTGTASDASGTPVVTVNGVEVTVTGVDWSSGDLATGSTIPVVATDASTNQTTVNVDVSAN